MDLLASLIGGGLDSPQVVAFFLTQPATAARRRRGRVDLGGIRSLSSAADGYEVSHRRGRIETVSLFLEPRDGYAAFGGPLAAGLLAGDGPAEVRRKLGPATRSGTSDAAGLWPWDRYDSAACCLRVGYREAGAGLRLLTLMAPDVAP